MDKGGLETIDVRESSAGFALHAIVAAECATDCDVCLEKVFAWMRLAILRTSIDTAMHT